MSKNFDRASITRILVTLAACIILVIAQILVNNSVHAKHSVEILTMLIIGASIALTIAVFLLFRKVPWSKTIRAVVFCFTVFYVTFSFLYYCDYPYREAAHIAPEIAENLDYYVDIQGLQKGEIVDIHRSEKLLLIDKNKWNFDAVYIDLPEDARATTPEEVDTVIWFFRGEQEYGEYSGGGTAYQATCVISVVDMETKTIYKEVAAFSGGAPPEYQYKFVPFQPSQDTIGDDPSHAEIINAILSIPLGD